MRNIFVPIGLICLMALPGQADTCPPPLEYAERKADLLETLQTTRDPNAGRFLTRELLSLHATAPNRRAQGLLDEGMALRSAGDLDAAIARFDALVAYCPNYAEGYNQRAFARYLQRDLVAALQDLDVALGHAPDHPGVMAGKGRLLMEMGDLAAGREVLRSALELNPWLPERRLIDHPPGRAA